MSKTLLTKIQFDPMSGDDVAKYHGFVNWRCMTLTMPVKSFLMTYEVYLTWHNVYNSPLMQALREDVAIED